MVRTFTGKFIDPFNPDPDKINIVDIAHALSNQCRFGGHLPKFKTVAEHCIETCMRAKKDEKLDALLHDATEYLLFDVPKPIKVRMEWYVEAEKNLMKVIAKKYGVREIKTEDISLIDKELMRKEYQDYMIDGGKNVEPMSRSLAKKVFLDLFYRFYKGK